MVKLITHTHTYITKLTYLINKFKFLIDTELYEQDRYMGEAFALSFLQMIFMIDNYNLIVESIIYIYITFLFQSFNTLSEIFYKLLIDCQTSKVRQGQILKRCTKQ